MNLPIPPLNELREQLIEGVAITRRLAYEAHCRARPRVLAAIGNGRLHGDRLIRRGGREADRVASWLHARTQRLAPHLPGLSTHLSGRRALQLGSVAVATAAVATGVAVWPVNEVRATAAPIRCPHPSHADGSASPTDHNHATTPAALSLAAVEQILDPAERSGARSQLVAAVDKVLEQLSVSQLVTGIDSYGQLDVSGYMPSRSDWVEIKQILQRDFPDISRISDEKVEFLDTRVQRLSARIARVQLAGKLDVIASNGSVLVDGTLSEAEAERWQLVKAAFEERYGRTTALVEDILTAPPISPPDLKIVGTVVSPAKQMLILADGRIYHAGDALPDGSIVKRISQRQATISTGGTEFILQVRASS